MNRRITWIRHGESSWNAQGRWQGHTDIELSDWGRQQAQSLGERLDARDYDLVFCSDLCRAQETAKLALPKVSAKVDSRLKEIHFGKYEGVTRDELEPDEYQRVAEWWKNPYLSKIEGGESMECLNTRVQEWMDGLPEGRIAVFTHGGVIRNAVWQVVGRPNGVSWRVSVSNTSITKIDYSEKGNLIHCINDASHLEKL